MTFDQRAYIKHLRDQAQRCYRYAESLEDRDFAAQLVATGRELDAEAEQRERQLAGAFALPPASRRGFATCAVAIALAVALTAAICSFWLAGGACG